MRKLLLMSILIMTLFIPIYAAGGKNVKQGARKTLIQFLVFVAIWTLLLAKIFWSLPVPAKWKG